MIRRCAFGLIIGIVLSAAFSVLHAEEPPFLLRSWPVSLSESLSDGAAVGRLRPRGMLQLTPVKVGGLRFSQLSGLAWDDDDEILYAISDKGFLFHLRPVIENDTLARVTLLKAVPLRELNGKPLRGQRIDSEGLEILNGRNGIKGDAELLISFERQPRIVRYRPDGTAVGELTLPAPLNNPKAYQDPNEMLESVCADAALGLLTAPEMPLLDEPPGMTRLFSVSGKSWRYPLTKGFGISALECLGDGRVLVLERTFGHLLGRNAVILKLVNLNASVPPGEALRPSEVATLDLALGHQIDNFEGLARHKGNRFFMVSDDNDLFVQRTLLLYFEILPEPSR